MDVYYIVCTALTILLGIVGYFTKRTIQDVDRNEKQIDEIKECINTMKLEYATKNELKELRDEIKGIGEAVQEVRLNYISKDDFLLKMADILEGQKRLSDKLDEVRYDK